MTFDTMRQGICYEDSTGLKEKESIVVNRWLDSEPLLHDLTYFYACVHGGEWYMIQTKVRLTSGCRYCCCFPSLLSQCGMVKCRDAVHGPQCSQYGTNEWAWGLRFLWPWRSRIHIVVFLEYETVCLVGGYQHFGVTYCLIIQTRFDFVFISVLSRSATCLTLLILLDLIILIGLWRTTNCNASHYTVFFCMQSHTLFSFVLSLRSSFNMRDQISNPYGTRDKIITLCIMTRLMFHSAAVPLIFYLFNVMLLTSFMKFEN
jgi:hypothetical protein